MRKSGGEVLKGPISGMWSVVGVGLQHPGWLALRDDGLLTLTFHVTADGYSAEVPHPTTMAIDAGERVTIVGETSGAGTITLHRCVRSRTRGGRNSAGVPQIEVTVIPHEAWQGAGPSESPDEPSYAFASFSVSGAHGAMQNLRFKTIDLETAKGERAELAAAVRAHTDAQRLHLEVSGPQPRAEITFAGKAFTVTLATTVNSAFSEIDGDHFETKNNVWITCAGASSKEILRLVTELERFLSIFCIGRIRPEEISISKQGGSRQRLLWRLGDEDRSRSVERMGQHVLVRLGSEPDAAARALEQWFLGSEQRRLARWLITENLTYQSLSISRFLAVTQAWEIIGRELDGEPRMPRKLFSKACKDAAKALATHLGDEQAQRLVELLRMGNTPSFSKLLVGSLRSTPAAALKALEIDPPAFAKAVRDTRNALTHMKDLDKLSVNEASARSADLTLKLVVLYCLFEARALKLPLARVEAVLRNNEFARMAMPATAFD